MKLTLTKAQMLAQWKQRRWLEPLRTDCRIRRSDGADLDAYAEMEMRQWYLDLLWNGPVELLAVTDLTLSATVRRAQEGRLVIDLPATEVRVVKVRVTGWQRDAEITSDPCSPLALRQSNRYARGGVEHPVAVHSGRRLELFSADSTKAIPGVEALWIIADPGPESYTFDERAWSLVARR